MCTSWLAHHFPIELRTTKTWMTTLTIGWAFHHQTIIKKIPYRLADNHILTRYYEDIFLIGVFSSQMTLACMKLTLYLGYILLCKRRNSKYIEGKKTNLVLVVFKT